MTIDMPFLQCSAIAQYIHRGLVSLIMNVKTGNTKGEAAGSGGDNGPVLIPVPLDAIGRQGLSKVDCVRVWFLTQVY